MVIGLYEQRSSACNAIAKPDSNFRFSFNFNVIAGVRRANKINSGRKLAQAHKWIYDTRECVIARDCDKNACTNSNMKWTFSPLVRSAYDDRVAMTPKIRRRPFDRIKNVKFPLYYKIHSEIAILFAVRTQHAVMVSPHFVGSLPNILVRFIRLQ